MLHIALHLGLNILRIYSEYTILWEEDMILNIFLILPMPFSWKTLLFPVLINILISLYFISIT